MKILFHIGVGNKDRPQRWKFVNRLFSDLARTLESMGHDCLTWNHPKANISDFYHNNMQSIEPKGSALERAMIFKPDWVFTWNGNSEGDKFISYIFDKKVIFGELGFFEHYKSVYFDFKGVNANSENLTEPLLPFDVNLYEELKNKYIRENITEGEFIFVPLQDEQDTNITMYSPFLNMNKLLNYVCKKNKEGIKILYKVHPKAPRPFIKPREGVIEVKGNVHHYLPYAKKVVGINSTVLLEALLYHNKVETFGKGITYRKLEGDEHKQYITHLYKKQLMWEDLKSVEKVESSIFYKRMFSK